MIKNRNVLILPAGSEIGLSIHSALSQCKEVTLFGAGENDNNHARFVFNKYHIIKNVNETGWLEQLDSFCKMFDIHYIFPAHDDVIVALATHQEKIPARVITSSLASCLICRCKSKTYNHLQKRVRVPKLYAGIQEIKSFPVFVKPDMGHGSQGAHLVKDLAELVFRLENTENPIICEYLPGEEFTVDCFSDREKGLLFCGARTRLHIRNGISNNTRTVDLPEAKEFATIIGKELNMRGSWFFQLKRALDGKLTLLEVAPRTAGAMGVHRAMGVNFPLLSLYEEERENISILINSGPIEMDRALGSVQYKMNLKYSSLYIDLDDTLILHDRVNLKVLQLIYQCLSSGKRIHLLTRHRGNLDQTLQNHRLSSLFDTVTLLPEGAKKSDYIKGENSIFIDDSFSERKDVSGQCSIPTFDCSMIEGLLNATEVLKKSNVQTSNTQKRKKIILGSMQPYFFPYLGYFDLIHSTDRWIVFDTVQYIRKGWINRNRILHPTKGWQYITIPIKYAPQSTPIREIQTTDPQLWQTKILGQLAHYRKTAPFYEKTIDFVKSCFDTDQVLLANLNTYILSLICRYLNLNFDYSLFSNMNLVLNPVDGPGDWALRMCESIGATEYINPPGGTSIFDSQRFTEAGINLRIQKPIEFVYSCNGYSFEPNLSIIDILMWNTPEEIKKYLEIRKNESRNHEN